jgi:hypothetical protein
MRNLASLHMQAQTARSIFLVLYGESFLIDVPDGVS